MKHRTIRAAGLDFEAENVEQQIREMEAGE
jgi:hypothetical protein